MWYLYLLTVIGGVANGLQPGLNATVRGTLGQPFVAALASVAGTTLTLVLIGLLSGGLALPEAGRWGQIPWWAWFAGAMGAAFILAQIYAARAIGSGSFLAITVGAAMLTSLLLDHFGLVGFRQHALNAGRLVGGALIFAGVLLVTRF